MTAEEAEQSGKAFYAYITMLVFRYLLNGKLTAQKKKAFIEEANQAGAAPSVTFEAPDDGALNVTSPEENPELDKLVKAMGI